MQTWFARTSNKWNRRLGGKFPHLTICAEVWIKDQILWIFLIDLIMYLVWKEKNHCENQYLSYGLSRKRVPTIDHDSMSHH